MSERTVLLAEALGHWVLAWTLVVVAVVLWIRVRRPRRPAIRYGGWLLATFAGAALLPVVVMVGPRVSWSEVVGLIRTQPAVPDPSDHANRFPILVRRSADVVPAGIGRGQGGSPGRSGRVRRARRSRRAALFQG